MKQSINEKNNQSLSAGVYLVTTPLGNLGDMTFRAVETLKQADVVFCEDTRVTGKLMQAFDIKTPMKVYNDHSEDVTRDYILELAGKQGKAVALVSDAGMPLISDPGYKLVRLAYDADVAVTTVPGASSVLVGLSLSGLPTDKFYFGGFLPSKAKARQDVLARAVSIPSTLIFFETANRLMDTLTALQDLYKEREIAVTRELTKKFEQVVRGTATELLNYYNEQGEPKGEIVLVIAPPQEGEDTVSGDDLDTLITQALQTMSLRDAVDAVMAKTGLKRKAVYNRAVELKRDI